jgi:urocanate hydratase
MSAPLGNDVSASPLDPPASLVLKIPDVYALFSRLIVLAKEHFSGELGGRLLLCGQLGAEGAAVALGANIAGAATLGVDADADRLRQGIRHGFCDFVVNSLDEALRILKNEIRKKQPVSVCLAADLVTILREAVERGLQPDLLDLTDRSDAVEILLQRGAIPVDKCFRPEPLLKEITWTAESTPALWLPKVDALAAKALPADDARLRWLKLAPRYLGRTMAGKHYLLMSAEEVERFSVSVVEAMASGAIGTKIKIQRQEQRPEPRR